jgi:hypothetical protein
LGRRDVPTADEILNRGEIGVGIEKPGTEDVPQPVARDIDAGEGGVVFDPLLNAPTDDETSAIASKVGALWGGENGTRGITSSYVETVEAANGLDIRVRPSE